ncbi:rod-binding protein [Sphingomonas sp. CGMCC 1.13654]|uniref:Rod-binding protein n=1 Tax=Sphingomonas chungangi TaxID=2683589 RepID=A0A838L149_9SPHN|nr:rod-binding protein [Sphingomonas chungangi]MBA2932924.1 rod-binding protein [Sphingomonas chungangi]MVW56544.1 flagellar biosynthesis protein FlgI [Sphingomonas chungangi]
MIQALPKLATAATTDKVSTDKAKLKTAAQQFEAVFLRQMIGTMRQASLGDGMFDSEATQQFQDMADSKTADAMSQKGVLHLADLLEKQLGATVAKQAGAPAAAATAIAKPDITSLATAKVATGAPS